MNKSSSEELTITITTVFMGTWAFSLSTIPEKTLVHIHSVFIKAKTNIFIQLPEK
jgi:hypothetical protein